MEQPLSPWNTPTRGQKSQKQVDEHSITEQRSKAVTRTQYTSQEDRPRPLRTSNQSSPCYSYTADDLHNSNCENSNNFIDSQQSDKQTSDVDSSSDASSQYQSTVCRSQNSEGLDADDEGGQDLEEDCCEADLQDGGGESAVKYGVEAEGLLLRKQEQENYAMRSRNR